MTIYAPGTQETDQKKQNMALQAQAAAITSLQTAPVNIATAGLATGGPITQSGTITVTAASKSDQQTGTSTTVVVTPGHQKDHDGTAKASVYFTVSGGVVTVQESYNVTSVVRASTGLFNITFTTAFANTFYRGAGIAESNTLNMSITASFTTTKTTSVYQLATINDLTGAVADPAAVGIAFFGRQ